MPKINRNNWTFKFSLWPSVLFAILLPLLLSLGIWQWGRADEKRALLALQEQRMREPPEAWETLPNTDMQSLRYRQVRLQGEYDTAHQFLVDNRVLDGRVGYFVLTPLRLHGGKNAVLVNRGWVPAGADRARLPDVTMMPGERTLIGRVNSFPPVGLQLSGGEIPTKTAPAVLQWVDAALLGEYLGYPLANFQVELDPAANDGYQRVWQGVATTIPPEKHIAYAIQWFGLALALLVLTLWSGLQKRT